jgi:tRNA pseudouridine65 synthase
LTLNIIFQTDDLIAINKPHGLLVHRSPIAADATEFAVQLLRDQIGMRVYPVHRLDRKTSGVLLFAKSPEVNAQVQQLFSKGKIRKTYKALLRGYAPEEGFIDYPLQENGKEQEAQTRFRRLQTFEIPLPFGKFSTSRYSLVELQPLPGDSTNCANIWPISFIPSSATDHMAVISKTASGKNASV